jgi:ribose 5-phosphate isomerase B
MKGAAMKILIGSDKSGFRLKEAIKSHLAGRGFEIEDCGTQDMEHGRPFFEVAPIAAGKIRSGEHERAILVCGTGMGMSIVANKYRGVHAACVESTYAAEKCRAVNNANVVTMGGWIIGDEMGCAIADKFLDTGFTDNLEDWRKEFLRGAAQKVESIEQSIYGT